MIFFDTYFYPNFYSFFLYSRCKQATDRMLQLLKNKNHKVVKLTLELIEICSKNGNLYYHRILAGKEFSD